MTLAALISTLILLISFSIKTTTLTHAHCLPHQRDSLIKLKQGFHTTKLHSWNTSTNCCIWDGITCNEQTGLVIALNLAGWSISGELNPALFNLSSLRYLDLSYNFFDDTPLPQTGFERLGNLTHLDLSYSAFVGQVPIGISALTNLISLDLSNELTMYLSDTGLKSLLGNLSKLQVLHLDGVNISINGNEWDKSVFQVSSNLEELSMAEGGLSGSFPEEIFHHTNLTILDLSYNPMLSGQLPEFTKQSCLQYLFLVTTNFTGPLPDSIGNLQYLSELSLSDSNFYGEIPPSIANLTRLEDLELLLNRLTGTIPLFLFSHPSLGHLDLSNNQLSGYLPKFSNGSSILESIRLGSNNLQGEFPNSIFKFPQLYFLSLESNNFNGTLNWDVIQRSKKLEYLDLSNNKLSIIEDKKFPSFLNYLTNIYSLDLSNNSLTGEIPLSICNITSLVELDLSYNHLTGKVPPCLLKNTELELLYLKSNKLNGPMPQNISKACGLVCINLNGNMINGNLPKLLKYCKALEVLDMGNNRIVNRFPYWLTNLENLGVLVLKSNMFYGEISDMELKAKGSDSVFPMLKVLDLSTNHFSGTLPNFFFVKLKAMMGVSNTNSFNNNNNYYPPYVASVTYKGQSFDLENSLGIFSYIDMSNNEFRGRIPEEIGQLNSLNVVNLSHNSLTGPIPSEFANLHQLQLLDLSSNQLSGHIPQELTSLTFLSALNLSYNNLVGEIPEARQFSTFSNASYLGNPRLCGSPLSIQCAAAPSNDEFDKSLPSKSSTDIIGLSVSIGLGLGVGFAFVIWAMISWENGRKWFNFIIDRFYIRHFH